MKEIGLTMFFKDSVLISILMERFFKENGKWASNTALASTFILMEIFTKVNGDTINLADKVHTSTSMGVFTRVAFSKVLDPVKGLIKEPHIAILVVGRMILCTVRGELFMKTETFMKVNL